MHKPTKWQKLLLIKAPIPNKANIFSSIYLLHYKYQKKRLPSKASCTKKPNICFDLPSLLPAYGSSALHWSRGSHTWL